MKKKYNNVIKIAIWIVKSLCIGILLIFVYNIIGSFFNLNIPINIWTILIVSFLKLPGLAALIVATTIW